jgi:hypothetical protein
MVKNEARDSAGDPKKLFRYFAASLNSQSGLRLGKMESARPAEPWGNGAHAPDDARLTASLAATLRRRLEGGPPVRMGERILAPAAISLISGVAGNGSYSGSA